MTSESLLGISIYGFVVMTITLVSLFTKGWTKPVIIVLVIMWIPLLFFMGALLFGWLSLLGLLPVALMVGAPLILIGVVFFIVWKFLNRFRD